MKSNDIDINSAANGIFLPVKAGHEVITDLNIDELVVSFKSHNQIHTMPYFQYLNERLSLANTQDEILFQLQEIRKALVSSSDEFSVGILK